MSKSSISVCWTLDIVVPVRSEEEMFRPETKLGVELHSCQYSTRLEEWCRIPNRGLGTVTDRVAFRSYSFPCKYRKRIEKKKSEGSAPPSV